MTERGPKPALVEFDGVGHAPSSLPNKIEPICQFLLGCAHETGQHLPLTNHAAVAASAHATIVDLADWGAR